MQMTITSVDNAPDELYAQVPIVVDLLRPLESVDGAKYWLGVVQRPIRWVVDGTERPITHVVVTARWVGDRICAGATAMPVGLAYVTDLTLLDDEQLDMAKVMYVAIGVCDISADV
jgi:hypothetical protein